MLDPQTNNSSSSNNNNDYDRRHHSNPLVWIRIYMKTKTFLFVVKDLNSFVGQKHVYKKLRL